MSLLQHSDSSSVLPLVRYIQAVRNLPPVVALLGILIDEEYWLEHLDVNGAVDGPQESPTDLTRSLKDSEAIGRSSCIHELSVVDRFEVSRLTIPLRGGLWLVGVGRVESKSDTVYFE